MSARGRQTATLRDKLKVAGLQGYCLGNGAARDDSDIYEDWGMVDSTRCGPQGSLPWVSWWSDGQEMAGTGGRLGGQ